MDTGNDLRDIVLPSGLYIILPHDAQAAKSMQNNHQRGHKFQVRSEELFLHPCLERREIWALPDVRTYGTLPAPSLPPATMAVGQSPCIYIYSPHGLSGVAIVDSYDVVMVAEIKAGLGFLPFKLNCSFL